MSNVGYATLQIIPSARGFQSNLDKSIAPGIAASGSKSGKRFGSTFAGSVLPALGGVTRVAKFGALGLGALGVAGAVAGVKTAASMEQAGISFDTLIGNTQKSKAFLGDLQQFAAKTPFTMPGVMDAARQLLGVGQSADDVIPTLTAFGDTAGALGISQDAFNRVMTATTQAMAGGKLQAGDMLQITQAGIPIWSILAKSMGKPVAEVRKLSQQGKLLTADVLPGLQAQMEKDYGGSMAKQSQTLSGLWSTFTDTLNIGLAKAIIPLEPMLRKAIPAAAGAMSKALAGIAGFIANDLVPGISWLVTTIRGVIDTFHQTSAASDGVAGKAHGVADALRSIGTFVMTQVIPALVSFAGFVQTNVLPVIVSIAHIIMADVVPILVMLGTVIVTQIVPIIMGLYVSLATSLRPTVIALAQAFQQHVLPALQLLLVKFRVIEPTLLKIIVVVLKVVVAVLKIAAAITGHVLPVLIRLAGIIIGVVIVSLVKAITFVVKVVAALVRFGAAFGRALTAVGRFASGVATKVAHVVTVVEGIPGKIVSALGDLGSLLLHAGEDLIMGFIHGITNKIGAVKSTLGGLTKKLTSWKGPPQKDARLLTPAGHLVIDGFVKGLEQRTGAVHSVLTDLTRSLPASVGAATVHAPFSVAAPPPVSPATSSTSGGHGAGGGVGRVTIPVHLDGRQIAEVVYDVGGHDYAHGRKDR